MLQWCDFGAPFGQPPLTSTRAAVCGARASFLRQGAGRPAAAGLFLAASGDPSALGALCRSTFAQAASALEGVLANLDKQRRSSSSDGSDSSMLMQNDDEAGEAEGGGGGLPPKLEALATAASQVNAVSFALELAWDQADRDADDAAGYGDDDDDDHHETEGYTSGFKKKRSVALGNLRVGRAGFGGGDHLTEAARDMGTLCAYRDLLQTIAPLLAAQGLRNASGTSTTTGEVGDQDEHWLSLVECCQKLDECVTQAPEGCAPHFLAVATHLLNRADCRSSSSSSRKNDRMTTPFSSAALERLLALLHASRHALTFSASYSSSLSFDHSRLNVALVKHLAYGFAQPLVAADHHQSSEHGAASDGDVAFGGPFGGSVDGPLGGPLGGSSSGSGGGGGGPVAAANGSGGPSKGLFIAPRDHGQRTGAAGAADFFSGAAGSLGAGWGVLRPQKGETGGGLGDDVAVFALGAEELLEMPPLY